MKKVLAVVSVMFLMSGVAMAKSSTKSMGIAQKTGVGFSNQIAGVDTISVRHWAGNYGIEGLLGYYSFDNSVNGTIIGGKYLSLLKEEKNLNCYWFAMLGLVNGNAAGVSASGTMIGGGLGVEFFLEGLPNLGFGAEIGVANTGGDAFSLRNMKGNSLFGSSINNAGIRYYFN